MPVSVFVTVTSAPGMAAPLESRTDAGELRAGDGLRPGGAGCENAENDRADNRSKHVHYRTSVASRDHICRGSAR